MPGQRHVVIVEDMRRNAVHQRRVGRREITARGDFRRRVVAGRRRDQLGDDARRPLVGARDHHADAVGDAHPCGIGTARRQHCRIERCDEVGGLLGKFSHDTFPQYDRGRPSTCWPI